METRKNRFNRALKTLLALTTAGLVACGGNETAVDHLESAKQSYTKNEFQTAIVELKNSLKKDSDNADARLLLGKIYSDSGMAAYAEKELKRALELGIPFNDVALPLANSMLMQGKNDEILKDFAIRFSDKEPTISIKSLILGESYFQARDLVKAREYFDAASQNNSTKQRALLGISLIALIKKNSDQAQSLVNRALEIDSKEPKAWMTQADIYQILGKPSKAKEAYENAVKHSRSNTSYYYQVAMRQILRIELAHRNISAADKTLQRLKKSFYSGQIPNDIQLTYLRANLAYQKRNLEKATELANKVLLSDTNHKGAKLLTGLAEFGLGNYEQAVTHLQSFLTQFPEHEQARKTLASAQSKTNKHSMALETLEPFYDEVDELDQSTLTLLAQTSYRAGQAEESSRLLEQALTRNPQDPMLNFALAQSFSAQSNFNEALNILESITGESQIEQQARLSQAQIYIRAKQYSNALDLLKQLEEELPNNPIPAGIHGSVLQLMGDTVNAKLKLKDSLSINPAYIPAIRALAALELQDNNIRAALKIYERALNTRPNNATLLLDYGQILLKVGKTAEAEQNLQKAKDIEGAEIAGSIMLARLHLAQKKPGLAKAELIEHKEKNIAAVWAELGNSQMMLSEFELARESYENLEKLEPSSPIPKHLIATTYLGQNNVIKAESYFSQSLELDKNFIPSLVAKANLALRQGNTDQAKYLLVQLQETGSTRPIILLKADIASIDNQLPLAKELYLDLHKSQPENYLRERLAYTIENSEGVQGATQFLEQEVESYPENPHALILLANHYVTLDKSSDAIELYKEAVKLEKNNVKALNNLAWLLKDSEPQRALEYAQRAFNLSSNNAKIKDTLDNIKKNLD